MPIESPTLPLTIRSFGVELSRDHVRAWEARRALKVAKRLGLSRPAASAPVLLRDVVNRKLEIGHERIEKLIAGDLSKSRAIGSFGARLSKGNRKISTVELSCPVGTGEMLPGWYSRMLDQSAERMMLAATPDHWILRRRDDGVEEVYETAGGSPFVMKILFGLGNPHSVTTPPDREFPVEWSGAATDADGRDIGGIRHMFRDRDGGGFDAVLNVEFPIVYSRSMLMAHNLHLASEFSNWLEFANGVREP